MSLSHILIILSAILLLAAGCTLLAMVCGMLNAQTSFTLYDTFSSANDGTAGATVRLILTLWCSARLLRGACFPGHSVRGV